MSAQRFTEIGIGIPPHRSGEVDTNCPQCSPTRRKSSVKCLSVNTETGVYYCHHCGWAGSVGVSAAGYGAPLSQRAGGRHRAKPAATPTPSRVYTMPEPPPSMPLPEEVVKWFANRGINELGLTAAGITAGQEWCPQLTHEVLAVRFPYLCDRRLVNIKYRSLDKHFWMVKGAQRILYGLDAIAGAETICLVEGEIDKLSIDTAGGPLTASVPDGAPPPDARNYASKFSFLDEVAMGHLRVATTVLIATDMDAPGQSLADELAKRIGYATCWRIWWPEGCKDANEVLVKFGAQALRDALGKAQPYPTPATPQHRMRPIHMLPPARGRRPVIELDQAEVSHAR
jgi:twinkle protein